jgi:hypothetical protein
MTRLTTLDWAVLMTFTGFLCLIVALSGNTLLDWKGKP